MGVKIDLLELNMNAPGYYYSEDEDNILNAERYVKQHLLPILESLFDELEEEFNVAYVDNAVVDLDVKALMGKSLFLGKISAGELRSAVRAELLKGKVDVAGEVVILDPNEWFVFSYILEKGYKPWNFSYKSHRKFELHLIKSLASLKGNAAITDKIKDSIRTHEGAMRLANTFSYDFVVELLYNLYAEVDISTHQFKEDLKQILLYAKLSAENDKNILILALVAGSTALNRWGARAGAGKILSAWEVSGLVVTLNSGFLKKRYSEMLTSETENALLSDERKAIAERDLIKKLNDTGGKRVRFEAEMMRELFLNSHNDQEQLEVSNTGIVLLASYLVAFLEKTNNYSRGELTDASHCVYLVQNLSGVKEIKDYDLALAKILCGLEPSTPLNAFTAFTELEILESEALLMAVISHWKVLKETSPEGLQLTFLQRPGNLQINSNYATLQVLRKTQDVLLDYIPWSFGMIKLPWMTKLLNVKW